MKRTLKLLIIMLFANTGLSAQQVTHMKETTLHTAYDLNPTKATPVAYHPYAIAGNEKDYDFYMKKSKNHRTVGWATLIGGVVVSGIGLLMAGAEYSGDGTAAGVVTAIGAASGIVSIPFMIMASAYKLKAKLLLEKQNTGFAAPPQVDRQIRSVTLVIPIGK